jgi:hypothetical protein
MVIGCLAKYEQIKNVLCCKLICGGRTLKRNNEIQLTTQDNGGPPHDAGQEKNHETVKMIPD